MTRHLFLLASSALALHAQGFDAASVKASARSLGPDYNNQQVTIGPSSLSAKNVTLKWLIVEAYGLVPAQVSSSLKWLEQAEYDVEAKADHAVSREELRKMLQTLLASRFHVVLHRETRTLPAYEVVVDKGGPKIQPVKDGGGTPAPLGSGRFHGELQELANLISIKLTMPAPGEDPTQPTRASGAPMPVFDKTGLTGTYDFDIEVRPQPGLPAFNLWQNILQEQLGLKLESHKGPVEVIVVDSADRVPVAN